MRGNVAVCTFDMVCGLKCQPKGNKPFMGCPTRTLRSKRMQIKGKKIVQWIEMEKRNDDAQSLVWIQSMHAFYCRRPSLPG